MDRPLCRHFGWIHNSYCDVDNVIIHRNRWFWGRKETIVVDGGNGLCHVCVEDDDYSVAYLTDVIVHPDARRRGLGNRLLELARLSAESMNAREIRLWVVAGSWMEEWHKRHGYEFSSIDEAGNTNLVLKLSEE